MSIKSPRIYQAWEDWSPVFCHVSPGSEIPQLLEVGPGAGYPPRLPGPVCEFPLSDLEHLLSMACVLISTGVYFWANLLLGRFC